MQQSSQDVEVQNYPKASASDYLNTVSRSTSLLTLDDIAAELSPLSQTYTTRAPSPTLGPTTGFTQDIPSFDFGPISRFVDYRTASSHGSSPPPSSEHTKLVDAHDGEESSFHSTVMPPAQKRRKLNPMGDADPDDVFSVYNSLIQQPSPQTLGEVSVFFFLGNFFVLKPM